MTYDLIGAAPAATRVAVCEAAPATNQVRIIRDLKDLESLRGYWRRWALHPNADIDAYISTLQSMPAASPLVFVAYRNDMPDAMLLGRSDPGELSIRFGYKTLASPMLRRLVFIYQGLLGNASTTHCTSLVAEVSACLRRSEADVAFFNRLKIDSALYRALSQLRGSLAGDRCPQIDVHRSITIPPGASDVFRCCSAKVRKNLKWQAKKLLKDFEGAVRFRCYQSPNDLDTLFQDVERVAKKTYQRGLGVGFMDNPPMRKRLHMEAERGWLRAYVLYIRDQPTAFWIGKRYGDAFYSDFMGYDTTVSKYSPGMYVVTTALEQMCASQDAPQSVDFGLGDAQYKAVLSDVQWQEASTYLFAPTLKATSVNLLRTAVGLADTATRSLLNRTELLQRTKTMWRRRIARQ
jgi:CelD/BcsL family acetyltransferase involved in cellulose biosynthesis